MKKHWVNPKCRNSEPTKRTVSILALVIYSVAISVISGLYCFFSYILKDTIGIFRLVLVDKFFFSESVTWYLASNAA